MDVPPLFFSACLKTCPAGLSQNVTNRNCLVCFESKIFAFGVIPRPLGFSGYSGQPQSSRNEKKMLIKVGYYDSLIIISSHRWVNLLCGLRGAAGGQITHCSL